MITYDINKIYEWPLITQVITIVILSVFVLYAGYFFNLSTLNHRLIKEQKAEQDLIKKYAMVLDQQTSLETHVLSLSKLKNMLNEWQQALLYSAELTEFLNEILKLGSENRLHITLFEPGEKIKENFFYKRPIKMVMLGNYDQIASFISQIANMHKLVKVSHFTLSNEKQSGKELLPLTDSNNQLKIELVIEVYEKNKNSI